MSDQPGDSSEESAPPVAVELVFQRFRQARLLLEEEQRVVTVGEWNDDAMLAPSTSHESSQSATTGILVYVSFSKSATKEKVEQAAKTVLNLPIATMGAWGDTSSTTASMLKLAVEMDAASAESKKPRLFLMIVPQANLISKVKNSGKSIQYHNQCAKSLGEDLYHHFCATLRDILTEEQQVSRGQAYKINKIKPSTPDPSIPPSELFRPPNDDSYGSWNKDGFPETTKDGEPLTKSAGKKLTKILQSHQKRHTKWLENNPEPAQAVQEQDEKEAPKAELDPNFCTLVFGNFGKRQGLELKSDMGPFCHLVRV